MMLLRLFITLWYSGMFFPDLMVGLADWDVGSVRWTEVVMCSHHKRMWLYNQIRLHIIMSWKHCLPQKQIVRLTRMWCTQLVTLQDMTYVGVPSVNNFSWTEQGR